MAIYDNDATAHEHNATVHGDHAANDDDIFDDAARKHDADNDDHDDDDHDDHNDHNDHDDAADDDAASAAAAGDDGDEDCQVTPANTTPATVMKAAKTPKQK